MKDLSRKNVRVLQVQSNSFKVITASYRRISAEQFHFLDLVWIVLFLYVSKLTWSQSLDPVEPTTERPKQRRGTKILIRSGIAIGFLVLLSLWLACRECKRRRQSLNPICPAPVNLIEIQTERQAEETRDPPGTSPDEYVIPPRYSQVATWSSNERQDELLARHDASMDYMTNFSEL